MSADETLIHVHEVDVGNVVHKKEELGLSPGRLRYQLMHLLERRHVWIVIRKAAHDVLAKIFSGRFGAAWAQAISHESEEHRRVRICEVERGKNNERAFGHIEVVALVSQISFVAIRQWNLFRTDENLSQRSSQLLR